MAVDPPAPATARQLAERLNRLLADTHSVAIWHHPSDKGPWDMTDITDLLREAAAALAAAQPARQRTEAEIYRECAGVARRRGAFEIADILESAADIADNRAAALAAAEAPLLDMARRAGIREAAKQLRAEAEMGLGDESTPIFAEMQRLNPLGKMTVNDYRVFVLLGAAKRLERLERLAGAAAEAPPREGWCPRCSLRRWSLSGACPECGTVLQDRDCDGKSVRAAAEAHGTADPERLKQQALVISSLLAEAGITGGTLPEGVRQLWIQRDDVRAENAGLLRENLSLRSQLAAGNVGLADARRAMQRAQELAESWHTKAVEAEGRVGLLLQALDQVVRELDDILDQKGHTARTRDVLAQARAVAKEVINGR